MWLGHLIASLVIVFHVLRLVCIILVDVMNPPISSVILGLLKYLLLYTSYRLYHWLVRPGTYSVRHPLGMCLLDASNTS